MSPHDDTPAVQPPPGTREVKHFLTELGDRDFTAWYEDRQFEQNILEGKAFFNGPPQEKPPEKHSPNQLLQCHRKATYTRQNAPREGTLPNGLFWIGTEVEVSLIVPYLQDTTPDDVYVQNSIWIDTSITVNGVDVRVRGATDPTLVTPDTEPIAVTEVKTTSSLDHLTEPKQQHRAQLHAYLAALCEEHETADIEGLLIYVSRETLDIEVFLVPFDLDFWITVKEWMATQTQYEQRGELPPADPERDWECSYCSYKDRCGKGDGPYSDIGPHGLLPLFDGYDRQNLEEYLEAHTDANAMLTPTLAHHFPELAEGYGAYDWSCPRCDETYPWDAIDWNGDTSNPPLCPACFDDGEFLTLSGPDPSAQHQV